jgi:hypothetical protein
MLWIDAAGSLSRSYTAADGCTVFPAVTIARTGAQMYHRDELLGLDIEAGPGGWVRVDRPESEVFSRRAIQSFLGKPVTLGHVGPDEAEGLAVGRVEQPRRIGDHLVADLRVCDGHAVALIRDGGWRGVSCGYDCSYTSDRPGSARQHGIEADHVAVLHPNDEARCGAACRIQDSMGGSMRKRETSREVVARLAAIERRYQAERRRARAGDAERTNAPSGLTTDRAAINARVAEQQGANRIWASRIAAFWNSQR